jgi:hypothetical protein
VNERDASSGGMTGATGDLTPAGDAEEFEPGELREIASVEHQADVTRSQASHAPEHADQPFDEERDAQIGGDERADGEERL